MTTRRALLAAALAAPGVARAQGGFPDRPIRLIYPFGPGAGDVFARAVAERLRETLGVPVVVENRPGANTMIGAEAAARAPRDGYTLGWVATSTLALNPNFYPNITYRLEDFAPLCLVYRAPVAFAVAADLPIRTVAEALAHMRRNPGLSVGTVGNGSSPHLTMEWLMSLTGVQLENVAYRGEQAILSDLVTGRIPFYSGSVNTLLPHLEGGRFRVLATSSPRPLPFLPGVPTFAETVDPQLVQRFWHGVVSQAGVPAPILRRLADAIAEAVRSDEVRRRATPDLELDPVTLDDFAALIREEQALYGRLIRARGITVG